MQKGFYINLFLMIMYIYGGQRDFDLDNRNDVLYSYIWLSLWKQALIIMACDIFLVKNFDLKDFTTWAVKLLC